VSSPTFEDIRTSDLVNPTPRQRQAILATSTHRFVLYGGGAGGGKSYILRWWCLRQLLRRFEQTGIRGLMVGLFSMDYPTLQDRQISKIEREFPLWLGATKRTEKEGLCFFVNEEYGGGRIALRNLADPSSYKSAEFCDIAVEELSENKRDVFEDLVLFRLRWPGIDRPCFLGGTNPTGIGVQWIKALWIPPTKFPKELKHLEHEFAYVPALLEDNPHLGADYLASLQGLPDKKRRALLEGDWSVPEGQYFTNFEPNERKVHPAVIGQLVKPWWSRWISQDWGFGHHTPVHWHAVGNVLPEDSHLLGRDWKAPKQVVLTYREHTPSLKDEQISEKQLGQTIRKKSSSEEIKRWILSSDAFAKKTSQNTAADLLYEGAGDGFPRPVKANMEPGSRIVGWRFLYSLIQEDRWFISEQCPEALDAIPALEYDTEKGDEDILKTDHLYDDIGDELRYGLVDMLAPRAKSQEEKDREKVEAAKPGMERELLRYKLTMDRNSSLVRAEERRPSHWD
jgi:phage terminase large subunit